MATLFEDDELDVRQDGRPSVIDSWTFEDRLFARLVEVYGLDYAKELLQRDAATRAAAEQAEKLERQHQMELDLK